MANILDKIIKDKKNILKMIKKNLSLLSIENTIKSLKIVLNFKKTIIDRPHSLDISEIKKASPSAGILVKNFNPLNIAKIYNENKVTCLSVLTEEKYFLGKRTEFNDLRFLCKIPILANCISQ